MVHLKMQCVYTFRAICRDEWLRGSAATAESRAAAARRGTRSRFTRAAVAMARKG